MKMGCKIRELEGIDTFFVDGNGDSILQNLTTQHFHNSFFYYILKVKGF